MLLLLTSRCAQQLKFHSDKDCLAAVLAPEKYATILQRSTRCPLFVFPLPKGTGFISILCQSDLSGI